MESGGEYTCSNGRKGAQQFNGEATVAVHAIGGFR